MRALAPWQHGGLNVMKMSRGNQCQAVGVALVPLISYALRHDGVSELVSKTSALPCLAHLVPVGLLLQGCQSH